MGNTSSKVVLARILQGLDISMGRNYVHAEAIKRYFPAFKLQGVYTVKVDCEDNACIEFVRVQSNERHIIDLTKLAACDTACLLKELMEQTSTRVIITLDGEVWMNTDITEDVLKEEYRRRLEV